MILKWNRLAVILVFGLTSLLVLVAFYGKARTYFERSS